MSEIRATTISDLAGTGPVTLTRQTTIKAWVNFDGTGTIGARDSYNLSSLTDSGTGKYDINMTSAMGYNDGSYGMNMDVQQRDSNDDGNCRVWGVRKGIGVSITGSKLPIQAGPWFYDTIYGFDDSNFITVSIYGDLA